MAFIVIFNSAKTQRRTAFVKLVKSENQIKNSAITMSRFFKRINATIPIAKKAHPLSRIPAHHPKCYKHYTFN